MSQTNVLYIHVTGVSSEILKNLVLAGIRATLFDPRPYHPTTASQQQYSPSFLLASQKKDACVLHVQQQQVQQEAENGEPPASKKMKTKKLPKTVAEAVQPVVEDLNPLLGACPILLQALTLDELIANASEIVSQFRIVVASRLAPSQAVALAQACTAAGNGFFLVDTFGMDAACIMDLGQRYTFRPELGKQLLDPKPLVPYISTHDILNHVPLHQAINRFHKQQPPTAWMRYRAILHYMEQDENKAWPCAQKANHFCNVIHDWIESESPSLLKNGNEDDVFGQEALQTLCRVADDMEIAPVCSVMGGVVGNEVIKAISGKGQPANNTLLLDGDTCKVWSFLVQPPPPKV
jgi:ubiquitin-like 1-activating enzyme E1 A